MRTLLLALSFFTGCTCRPTVTMVEESRWSSRRRRFGSPTPSLRRFRTLAELEVTNPSRVARAVTVELSPPFSLRPRPTRCPREERASASSFTPVTAGSSPARCCRLAGLEVPLSGLGLAPLSCDSPNVCTATRFDPVAGRCVASAKPRRRGVPDALCDGPVQVRAVRRRGHGLPETRCTVGVCSEDTGCGVVARTCAPPSNPCQRARCDEASGCLIEDADDGVVCGVDDCRLDTVNVCITGQCVTRTRPGSGRCTRTWLPLALGSRSNPVLGYDVVGRRMLLFAGGGSFGSSDDTAAVNAGQPGRSSFRRTHGTKPNTPWWRPTSCAAASSSSAGWRYFDCRQRHLGVGRHHLVVAPRPSGRGRHRASAPASSGTRPANAPGSSAAAHEAVGTSPTSSESNGLVWRQVGPAVMPRPRLFGQFVYSPVRRVAVLFGGVTNSGSGDRAARRYLGVGRDFVDAEGRCRCSLHHQRRRVGPGRSTSAGVPRECADH